MLMTHASIHQSLSLPFQNKHILVVEDSPINQVIVVELLEQLGCITYVAEHGKIALQQLANHPIDLILMDCHMPEMDGFATTRAIRAQEQQQRQSGRPIIALTATVLEQDKDRCFAAGMNDFLAKPVHVQTMRIILSRWLKPNCAYKPPTQSTTATVSENIDACLDEAYLIKLRDDMGERGITWLIELFLGELPRYVAEIEHAVARQDAEAVYQAAHRLKGSAANVGAKHLIKLCLELETLSHQPPITPAATLIAVYLTQEHKRLKNALEKLKDV